MLARPPTFHRAEGGRGGSVQEGLQCLLSTSPTEMISKVYSFLKNEKRRYWEINRLINQAIHVWFSLVSIV